MYTVTWFCGVVKPSKRSRYIVDLGLCEYSNSVAFLAVYKPQSPATMDAIKPLFIKDVTVENNRCDDAQWCLALNCRLNKAELNYFRKKGIRTRAALVKLHEVFEKIKRDLKLQTGESGILQIFKKPPVYLSVKKRQK